MTDVRYCVPKVKICGITSEPEITYLNEAKADYAGFVFYEKSKRNVAKKRAAELMQKLDAVIIKVAVTVSPSSNEVQEINALGFDILQVHGELNPEAVEKSGMPIWKAINISEEIRLRAELLLLPQELRNCIQGLVADGASYGAGIPFSWKKEGDAVKQIAEGRQLILAGGLNSFNVTEGIKKFRPDVVDVSTGVEEDGRKNRSKITEFIRKVREHG